MTLLRPLLLIATLFLAACAGLPARDGDIDATLAASGIDAQLAWLEQPLRPDQMSGTLALLPDDWVAAINAAVAAELRPAGVRADLRAALGRELNARELGEVRRFYESPAGRAVVAVEAGRGGTAPAGGDEARLAALAEATGLGKAVSRLAEKGLGDAFDIALRTNCLGQGETRFAGLVGGVIRKAQLRALRRLVDDQVQGRYAALTPDEQAGYLAFAQSGAGTKFFRVRATVLANAADRAGNSLGQALTPRFEAFCGKGR